jgi:hypothetical protein
MNELKGTACLLIVMMCVVSYVSGLINTYYYTKSHSVILFYTKVLKFLNFYIMIII